MKCAKCGIRDATSDSLYCKRCDEGFIKTIDSKHLGHNYRTFRDFYKEIRKESEIHRFLILDDVLTIYHYFQKFKKFDPILGPDFRFEHEEAFEELEKVLKNIALKRIGFKADFQKFPKLLRDFRESQIEEPLDIKELILFLKKSLRSRDLDLDTKFIDELSRYFVPGSALFDLEFLLELFSSGVDLPKFISIYKRLKRQIKDLLEYPVLLVKPWIHQKRAIEAWLKNGGRGILEMATGTGKTVVGLYAIQKLSRDNQKINVLVTAHSRAILEQWKREACEKLGILSFSGYEIPINTKFVRIEFETIQKLIRMERYVDLLIVDEVHHAIRGPEFRNIFETVKFKHFLGLSASPEEGEVSHILEELNLSVIFRYGLREAIQDGILPEFEWFVHPIYMSLEELEEFERVTKQIRNLLLEISQEDLRKFLDELKLKVDLDFRLDFELYEIVKWIEKARYSKIEIPEKLKELSLLLNKRRWIIHRSIPRIEDAIKLAKYYFEHGKKVIVFAMDIESCELIAKKLGAVGDVFLVHSEIKNPYDIIEGFKKNRSGILIGAKMLDEGIDIPDAEVGINVASSKTRLQLIQRLGRILRKFENKKPIFHHYVAIPPRSCFLEGEDSYWMLDDLSWVIDTAIAMGCNIRILKEGEIYELYDIAEKRVRSSRVKTMGTLKIDEIVSQFDEDGIRKLLKMLETERGPISDERWFELLKSCFGRLNIKGAWWIVAMFERDPQKISEFLKSRFPF